MNKFLLVLTLLCSYTKVNYAQSTPNSRMESIEKRYSKLDPSKKIKVAVSSFKNSTSNPEFNPDGLVDMLSNALYNSNCFNVLDRINLKDVIKEQNLSNSKHSNNKQKIQKGQLCSAQLLVIGNVTEFQEGTSGSTAAGGIATKSVLGSVVGRVASSKAHLGMIIKLVDTKTGEVIDSKSFDRNISKVGIIGGGLQYSNTFPAIAMGGVGMWKSKAMQDAAEELIIDIIQYIIKCNPSLTSYNSQQTNDGLNTESVYDNQDALQQCTLNIRHISYQEIQKIVAILESNKEITHIDRKYENKTVTFTLTTNLNSDKIADFLLEKSSEVKLVVEELNENKIGMKTK